MPEEAQRAAWLAALDEPRLAELTEPAIMARGRQILASDAIQRPELTFPAADKAVLLATVVGTQPYAVGVMLSGASRVALEASCTCPHAEDGYFCKHQVALALLMRAELSGEAVAVDAATAQQHVTALQRAATVATRTAALHNYLAAQPSEVLAKRLMQLAGQWPEIRRELSAWQAMSEAAGDTKSTAKLIAKLLPLHDFLDWRDSNAYARSAAQVLPVLQGTLQGPPADALHLIERAYLILQMQLHHADDSDGQIGSLCADVGDLWLQALHRAGPQPAAFGDRYATLCDDAVFDAIPHAQALAAMGEAVGRRYGERLRANFEAALAASKTVSDRSLWSARYRYLAHLDAAGDPEERLRVMRASLETESDHGALIEELDRLNRSREALDCAERAHRLFPDDLRIEELLLAIYARDGWDAEALAVRQARFARQPGARSALAVLQAASLAKVPVEPLREQMWQALIDAEQEALARWQAPFGLRAQHKPAGPEVSERLAWLMQEGRHGEALALAQPPHRAEQTLLRKLALTLPRDRDADAATLLLRCFDAQMAGAASPYAVVLELVRRITERLPDASRADWLATLRQTYRAKRNFIRGLP